MTHRLNYRTGHLRKLVQACLVTFSQWFNDFKHITTGAEIAPSTGHHNGTDLVTITQLFKDIPQFGVGLECQRIFSLRTIQRNCRDPVGDLPTEVLGLIISHVSHVHSSCCSFNFLSSDCFNCPSVWFSTPIWSGPRSSNSSPIHFSCSRAT